MLKELRTSHARFHHISRSDAVALRTASKRHLLIIALDEAPTPEQHEQDTPVDDLAPKAQKEAAPARKKKPRQKTRTRT